MLVNYFFAAIGKVFGTGRCFRRAALLANTKQFGQTFSSGLRAVHIAASFCVALFCGMKNPQTRSEIASIFRSLFAISVLNGICDFSLTFCIHDARRNRVAASLFNPKQEKGKYGNPT